jgi:hypothetical protein
MSPLSAWASAHSMTLAIGALGPLTCECRGVTVFIDKNLPSTLASEDPCCGVRKHPSSTVVQK